MFRRESGSEIVQFVCVMPLLLAIVFGIIQVALTMFSAEVFFSEVSQASLRIDTAGLVAAVDKERFVADEIVGQVSQLDAASIEVKNVVVGTRRDGMAWDEAEGGLKTRLVATDVSFDALYRPASIIVIPGWSNEGFSRHVSFSCNDVRAVEVQVGA